MRVYFCFKTELLENIQKRQTEILLHLLDNSSGGFTSNVFYIEFGKERGKSETIRQMVEFKAWKTHMHLHTHTPDHSYASLNLRKTPTSIKLVQRTEEKIALKKYHA